MIPAVYKAVQSLFAADTGTGHLVDLLTNGYYVGVAPVTAVPPFMVGNVQSSGEDDAFGSDGSTGLFAFNVYTPRVDSSGNAVSIGPNADAIIARLRTVYHKQQVTVDFNGINWIVTFQASSGIMVPEAAFAFHHAEVYRFTCYPA